VFKVMGVFLAALALSGTSARAAGPVARTTMALRGTVTDTSIQGAPLGNGRGIPATFEGRGHFDGLGNVSEKGRFFGHPSGNTIFASGHATFYVAGGGAISFFLIGSDEFVKDGTRIKRKADFEVTGGTGRYARAAGRGTIRAICPNDINSSALTCRSTWRGSLSYPRTFGR
jgi:hypothetical protein